MRPDLPRLDLPAEEGARVLALARVGEADRAAARLAAGRDGEALHDFRVALRRLRTVLRAFRPWLSAGPRRRHLRRLGRLAAATNPARDAEVQLAWLAEQRGRLAPDRRAGLDWLAARYEARRGEGEAVAECRRRWQDLARKLRARLETYERRVRPLEVEPTGAVLASLVRERLSALLEALAQVAGPDDAENAHRARIEGKRLRYLLEPLSHAPGLGAREAVRRLKKLQDILGELHDVHVLLAEIAVARRQAAGGPRPPALAGVERIARARCDRLHAALAGDAAGGDAVALAAQVTRVADALAAGPRAPATASGAGRAPEHAPARRQQPGRAADRPAAATTH